MLRGARSILDCSSEQIETRPKNYYQKKFLLTLLNGKSESPRFLQRGQEPSLFWGLYENLSSCFAS
jgi:hypothetical protein